MIGIARKLLGILTVAFVMAGLLTAEAGAEKKIGVLLWSEEGRYTDTLKGVMEQLKKDGFGEPAVKYAIENAQSNKAKAVEMAQKFAAAKMDLVIPIGTFAAIAIAKEIKDVPVVFGMIYDPVDIKIAESWQSSGNNTTGSSPKFPMSKLVSTLKQLAPIKVLAVLYTPGQQNSESQLKELQEIQAKYQIKVIPVPLTKKEDVARMLPSVTGLVDATYLSGSTIAGEMAATIVNLANTAKVITVTHSEDLVVKGVLLGVCADPFSVGRLAGAKAARVLKGAKPSSIPIETPKTVNVIVNMKTAKTGQIQVPPAFLKTATKVIE